MKPPDMTAARPEGTGEGRGENTLRAANSSAAPSSISVPREFLVEVVDGLRRLKASTVDPLRVHYLLNELEELQCANPVLAEALRVIVALEDELEELRDKAGGIAYDVLDQLDGGA